MEKLSKGFIDEDLWRQAFRETRERRAAIARRDWEGADLEGLSADLSSRAPWAKTMLAVGTEEQAAESRDPDEAGVEQGEMQGYDLLPSMVALMAVVNVVERLKLERQGPGHESGHRVVKLVARRDEQGPELQEGVVIQFPRAAALALPPPEGISA
jgi:hypothetical protein